MQAKWRVGSLFGIPFFIDTSWFLIVLFIVLGQGAPYWLGIVMALGLFGSVLAHELAHSLVAMKQGIKVNSITLFIFGGVAQIEREAATPIGAFGVAVAGPAFSLSFAGFLQLVLVSNLIPGGSVWAGLIGELLMTNLIIGLFNLLPGLPLDGGQILKSLIWGFTGNRRTGARWAARTGQWVGYGLIGLALLTAFYSSNIFNGLWPFLVGLFILNNARTYGQYNQLQQSLADLKARDVMTRNFRVLDQGMSLREFVDRFVVTDRILQPAPEGSQLPPAEVYFAESDGRYKGLVVPEKLSSIERSLWDNQTLAALLTPIDQLQGVKEETPVPEVIGLMQQLQTKQIPVMTLSGSIAGLIDKGDIVAGLAKQMGYAVAPEMLQRIREQNEFPPGFPIEEALDPKSAT